MTKLDHGLNDAFVRAARDASPEGQTEIVYAMRVEYDGKETEYWDVQPTPFDRERLSSSRQMAIKWGKSEGNPVTSIELVSRRVTITSDDWAAVSTSTEEP